MSAAGALRLVTPLALLLLFIAVFQFVTMPKFIYSGDNYWPRIEAARLIDKGEFGRPYTAGPEHPAGVLRGQYTFENDDREKSFSKYGILNTLLYVPPLFLEKLYDGRRDAMSLASESLLFLNLYQILFTLGSAAYLFLIVSFYTHETWLRVGFVLATFYTTFLWHYFRAPALEIFHILPFLGFYYHMLRFFRGRENPDDLDQHPWRHLSIATAWTGVLMLTKLLFALVFMLMGLFSILAGPRGTPVFERIRQNVFVCKWKYVVYLGIPSVIIVLILAGSNYYRFGSIFESGYGQWITAEGVKHDSFSLSNIPRNFLSFFYRPGNANVFLHYPLFAFGLFGFVRFGRRHPLDSAFLLFIFVAILVAIMAFNRAKGEWCYGPRYLLHILIIGSLPVVVTFDLLATVTIPAARWIAKTIILLTLTLSFFMQVNVNSVHYFTWYHMVDLYRQYDDLESETLLRGRVHRGLFYFDLLAYTKGLTKDYPLLLSLQRRVPAAQQEALRPGLEAVIERWAQDNYFFAE